MDEILINTSTVGNQEQPAIAAFRGTQFVAVWEDREDGNIKGQMLSPSGNKTSGEFVVNFPGPAGDETPNAGDRRNHVRVCRCMDRAGARRRSSAEASDIRSRHAVRAGDSGQLGRGGAAVAARDGASERRRLRRRVGRQARGRAHPRATLRIGWRKGRPRVSRQHPRRAAPEPDDRLSDQREHRDRLARAPAGLSAPRPPPDIRRQRAGRRRADDRPRHHPGRHGAARFGPVRHRPRAQRLGRRARLRDERRAGERVRGKRRLPGHPLPRDHRSDPDRVAGRRAALRRPLRRCLDASQHRRSRGRVARDGEALRADRRRDRQRRSGRHLHRPPRAVQPARRRDGRPGRRDFSSRPGPTTAKAATIHRCAPCADGRFRFRPAASSAGARARPPTNQCEAAACSSSSSSSRC